MSLDKFPLGQEFLGLIAVITGGTGGIGSATADYLSARGAKVALLDTSKSSNNKYFSIICDITNDAEVMDAIATIVKKFGGIDILINNAGIGAGGDVATNSDSEWQKVFDVNVFGAVRVTRAAMEYLKKSSNPAIVNTCSVVSEIGIPNRALYSASKGALEALTRAMAADYLPLGIRINAVSPATADTPWVARLLSDAPDPAAMSASLIARQPMKRLISAEEVAHAIAYLASPLSGSTTGTILKVDAGLHSLRIN